MQVSDIYIYSIIWDYIHFLPSDFSIWCLEGQKDPLILKATKHTRETFQDLSQHVNCQKWSFSHPVFVCVYVAVATSLDEEFVVIISSSVWGISALIPSIRLLYSLSLLFNVSLTLSWLAAQTQGLILSLVIGPLLRRDIITQGCLPRWSVSSVGTNHPSEW